MADPCCCSCEAAPGSVQLNGWALCASCALDYLDPGPFAAESEADWLGVPGGRGFDDARDEWERDNGG